MTGDSGALVRTVSRVYARQGASELQLPEQVNPYHNLHIAVTLGDPSVAHQMLVAWLRRMVRRGLSEGWGPEEWFALLMTYWRYKSHTRDHMRTLRSELSAVGQCTDEDWGKQTTPWRTWVSSDAFTRLFNTRYGSEVNLVANKGKGKTHTQCLLSGEWLGRGPDYHVIHNINQFHFDDEDLQARTHRARCLSDILRIWLELPRGVKILLHLDEPGTTLQAKSGGGKQVEAFNEWRGHIRKMGMTVCYAWQWRRQIFKWLREGLDEKDEAISLIEKPSKQEMVVHQWRGGTLSKVHIPDVPGREGFSYADEDSTSILMDLSFAELVIRTYGRDDTSDDLREAYAEALQDPLLFFEDRRRMHFSVAEIEAAKAAVKNGDGGDRQARLDEVEQAVRDNITPFLGTRGGVIHTAIRDYFGITFREAEEVARRVNKDTRVG